MAGILPLGAFGIAASAQEEVQGGDAEPGAFRIVSDTELVIVDVGVSNGHGGFVSGLTKDNFAVVENGKRRPITSFSAGDQPVTVGLIIDRSGSMRDKWQDVLTAAGKLADTSNRRDEFYVVTFADRVVLNLPTGTPFTGSSARIHRSLMDLPLEGRTALYDGIAAGLEHLRGGRHERKALVVLSDGGDNASSSTRMSALQAAARSLATIYAIGIFDASDQDADPRFLSRLARITGGTAFFPKEPRELDGIAGKIAEDIRARYTLGFSPADARLDNTVRKFKVWAGGPGDARGWKVHSRHHYVASSRAVGESGIAPR